MRMMVIQIVVGTFGTVSQRIGKEIGRNENQTKNQDNPHNNIVEIGQYTGKNIGDPRRLAAT